MAEAKTSSKNTKKSQGFSDGEKEAMRERAREVRSGSRTRQKGEDDLLAKIAEMPEADRQIAERLHEVVTRTAPDLSPRTWYGMPAYAKDGKVLCFFQAAAKFDSRYATFGFNDVAKLDDGPLWPTAFAVKKWTPAVEKQLVALIEKAVG